MAYEYMSLQGATNLARNVEGGARILRELGNQTALTVGIESEKYERFETKTGKRQKVLTRIKTQGVNLEITMDEQKREDIALAFHGEMQTTQAASETTVPQPTLKVGDKIKLDGFNLTEVVVKDSTTSTAVTAVEGEHYKLNAAYGTIEILKLDGLTQPLNVTYMSGETQSTVFFSLPNDAEYYLLFEGINSVNDKRLALELWRFSPEIDGSMDFINEETGEISIKGSALADPTKSADPKLGGFGRIVYLD